MPGPAFSFLQFLEFGITTIEPKKELHWRVQVGFSAKDLRASRLVSAGFSRVTGTRLLSKATSFSRTLRKRVPVLRLGSRR